MTQIGGALANILHMLELPDRPAVGLVGLNGTTLQVALQAMAGCSVTVEEGADMSAVPPLDLLVAWEHAGTHGWSALRPGGWLVLLRSRKRWRMQVTLRQPEQPAATRRWLVSPGFYFPYAVVPCSRMALRSHEIATREPGWKRTLRLAAMFLGAPAREFTGEVVAMQRA